MSTATLRESLDTVFTDGDWFLDIAFATGDEATPENITTYDHYLTLSRRVADRLAERDDPIKLSTEDGTLLVTAPNLVGPRVRAPQLQEWEEGVYDFEQSWLRPDGVTEVVFVGSLRVQTGLSVGGSFGTLPIPSGGPSYTVVRSPSQARVVRSARGAAGWNGWTAVLAVDDETAPPRRLMRVIDWAGGGGQKPTVGAWLGAGGLVTDPDDASDFAGASTAEAVAAAQLANEAAEAANAAAQDAVEKTALAVTATEGANDAADLAGERAAQAGAATEAANEATELAVEKTALAVTATEGANDAADLAAEKTALAVTATEAAVEATEDAVEKTALTVIATGNANDKAQLADTAATAANVATAAALAALAGATGQVTLQLTGPRVLTAADHGKLLAFTGDRPALVYVPAGLPAGFRIEAMKGGAANLFVVPLPGVAVGGVDGKTGLSVQYASELLRQIAPNNYAVTAGDSAAAPPFINFPDFSNRRASGQALFWFA